MKTKASKIKFLSLVWLGTLALSLCGGIAVAGDERDDDKDHHRSTAEDFLRLGVRPIAIGHHGVGPNRGENPALPIENTVDSVRQAYLLGARVVESAWPGYANQKNHAAEHASYDWILSLDADESLSEALEAEIWRLKKSDPHCDAYTMPRMAQYLGRWIVRAAISRR